MPTQKPSKTVKQSSQPTHNLGAEDFGCKDFDSPTESLVVRKFIFTPYPYGPKQPLGCPRTLWRITPREQLFRLKAFWMKCTSHV